MQNKVVKRGCVLLNENVVIVGRTKSGLSCVITGNSVEELQADWEGERNFFPDDIETIQFVSVNGHVVKKGRPVISGEEKVEDVIPNMDINTRIRYLYRDADNYKTQNEVVVKGAMTPAQVKEIVACLHDGDQFIPEQVGLPARRMQGFAYDPEADTPYFEIGEAWITPTGAAPTVDMSADELVRHFREADGRWNESIDISW